jgi:hypothetical protein
LCQGGPSATYFAAREYALTSVEKETASGFLASDFIIVNAIKMKAVQEITVKCDNERLGELRFFSDDNTMRYCRKGIFGEFIWKRF